MEGTWNWLFHKLTPSMLWEQTEDFTWKSCHSSANTEDGHRDLGGKKDQDKAHTMGMSGTLLMTIIWVEQR